MSMARRARVKSVHNYYYAVVAVVIMTMCFPITSSSRFIPLLKGAHAFTAPRRLLFVQYQDRLLPSAQHHDFIPPRKMAIRQSLLCGFNNRVTLPYGQQRPSQSHCIHHASNNSGGEVSSEDGTTSETLTMEKIYCEWTLEDDKLLYDNKHLSTVRLASLLGRGMHGVEARLKKLTNMDSTAYSRLFGVGNTNNMHDPIDEIEPLSNDKNSKLTPVKEVLRRIQWDPTLPSSSFTILHYDRVEDNLSETPFDAPNNSISGKETQFIFALPEHRIEGVKYLDRTVWDKEMRLDCVFGSMNGNGETIDRVIETYDEWKREMDEREERNRRWQIEILKELTVILEDRRVGVLKELSSQLTLGEWDSEGVNDYVKQVLGLYHDAKRGKAEEELGDFIEVADFLYLFSDLVALLSDALLREEILKEVESVVNRSLGEGAGSPGASSSSQPGTLPELKEEELDEKFVKGSGAGGQKVNKTSNRVVLTHIPTQVRVECQDTRSLTQNRKLARKRLRLKVDAFLNGDSSRTSQKASVAVAKKAKNKSRTKRRQKQKKKKSIEED
mmetsp:Transcript_23129/g.50096  ORF Transcript_23129/g.50096 Transcript_23129/m.50096 type:complete len:556 (+) Transcript_23129:277-1944(+)|eukprot:CAMPEP_0172305526 /NCGR_PEP_ID=MMETSP1058-20130122/6789_1 /TAXON_ID=83371 /ORGANISM="Detonula confervacea, Strain CCMP 353" /LENGTH=555 /DNA_ID=CAMNT_0013017145 /DNA_START=231 /DNA_END=1898 /DNA_ORIENTATION=+